MKKVSLLKLLLCVFIVGSFNISFSQNVAINATGAAPNNSAELDISSLTKGLLIPRMSTTDRDNIATSCSCTPANGLQIFNTTTNCIESYINSSWTRVACGCPATPATPAAISGTGTTVCQGRPEGFLYTVPVIANATNNVWSYSGTGVSIVGSGNAILLYFSASATSGNLTVTGNNICGSGPASADFPIIVKATPAITLQPTSPAAVCAGTGAPSFTVAATGDDITYNWQEERQGSWYVLYDGGVYSGVHATTLTITNPTADMNGNHYRCIAAAVCGPNGISDGNATLTVYPSPAITNSPMAQTISSGGSTTLVTLTSDADGATFAWTASASPNVSGYTSSGTDNIPVQTLTNPGPGAGTVTYAIIATANGCVGNEYDYVVTVNGPSTVIFTDDFHRSDDLGSLDTHTDNGWTDYTIGNGFTYGISNNTGYSSVSVNGSQGFWRNDITPTSGVAATLLVSNATGNGGNRIGVGSNGNLYYNGGYYVYANFNATSDNLYIGDESGGLAVGSYAGFNTTDIFAIEMDISADPQNWMDVYVWNTNTESKPGTPNASFHNSGSNFTPTVSGNAFYVWNGNQDSGPALYYNYEVKTQ